VGKHANQLWDSAASLGYEKSVILRLNTIRYGQHAPGRQK
jgi:hypothetical protein